MVLIWEEGGGGWVDSEGRGLLGLTTDKGGRDLFWKEHISYLDKRTFTGGVKKKTANPGGLHVIMNYHSRTDSPFFTAVSTKYFTSGIKTAAFFAAEH